MVPGSGGCGQSLCNEILVGAKKLYCHLRTFLLSFVIRFASFIPTPLYRTLCRINAKGLSTGSNFHAPFCHTPEYSSYIHTYIHRQNCWPLVFILSYHLQWFKCAAAAAPTIHAIPSARHNEQPPPPLPPLSSPLPPQPPPQPSPSSSPSHRCRCLCRHIFFPVFS